MRPRLLLWGAVGGAGIAFLKYVEYRWLVMSPAGSLWGGVVALFFIGLGLWLGRRYLASPVSPAESPGEPTGAPGVAAPPCPPPPGSPLPAAPPAVAHDAVRAGELGLTPRERQVLDLIAAGHSNREIAARLFVSENTVKTHSARVLDKLGARRRTQAVQRARELGVLDQGHPKA